MIFLENLQASRNLTLSLTATIETALCVGAGGSSGSLADKPILRDGYGHMVIPASQLKGKLRHQCERLARSLGWPVCQSPTAQTLCPQLAHLENSQKADFHRTDYAVEPSIQGGMRRNHCLICQIFGNPARSSQVLFDDLICTETDFPEVLRPGVTISRTRRTAEYSRLYFLETSPVGVGLQFKGNLHIRPQAPPQTLALLLSGLRLTDALGGSKSTGLGWLKWEVNGELDVDWSGLLPGSEP